MCASMFFHLFQVNFHMKGKKSHWSHNIGDIINIYSSQRRHVPASEVTRLRLGDNRLNAS